MKLCPHGDRDCPHSVLWVSGFYGCTNMKREMLDVEWCGKSKGECKGKDKDGTNTNR